MNQSQPIVLGIASGKGGVGKTTLSVNLSVALVQAGFKTMLFDGDMGLANAQIALGQRVQYHFGHVLAGEKSLQEITVKTPQGVWLIPGGSGIQELATLGTQASGAIVQAFSDLNQDLDFLIVDGAAGISTQVVTFMTAADRRLIVVKDEPSSIADAYGMIKVLAQEGVTDEVYLVPNMVPSQAAGQLLFQRLADVVKKFLGLTVGYLGSISADELVLTALRQQKTVVEHSPGTIATRDYRKLVEMLTQLPRPAPDPGCIGFFSDRPFQERSA
ncbi:MAG: Flagellum site-determining protein YlxH [Pseudomonadota bacterium]